MKKEIKNLHKIVKGHALYGSDTRPSPATLNAIITNDRSGKTLSINDGNTQFTIPFEAIERYLK